MGLSSLCFGWTASLFYFLKHENTHRRDRISVLLVSSLTAFHSVHLLHRHQQQILFFGGQIQTSHAGDQWANLINILQSYITPLVANLLSVQLQSRKLQ